MSRLPIVAAALAAALLAAPAAEARVFSQVDRDRDGRVTWSEARLSFRNVTRAQFSRCDRDRTGWLNFTQFQCLRSIDDALENLE